MVEKAVVIVRKIKINLMITLIKSLVKRRVTRRERNKCHVIKTNLVGQKLYKNVRAMEKGPIAHPPLKGAFLCDLGVRVAVQLHVPAHTHTHL
jgi:hypothetical protein|tara:strand:+ start:261 stop:539 length:279 start_codon:yes stop_codon:yes gene_type:complete